MNKAAESTGYVAKYGLYAGILSILILSLLLIAVININFIAPISGDLWYCFSLGGHNVSGNNLIEAYFGAFMEGNPRIGELLLYIACQSLDWRILIKVSVTILFVLVAFTVTFDRFVRPLCLLDCTIILLLFASIWTSKLIPGRMLFYDPYSVNYVFGYTVLLFFLIPFRFILSDRPLPHEPLLIVAMPALGVLAGLSNEHTPPVHIFLLGAALAFCIPRFVSGIRATWMLAGWMGLVAGYTLLFFAPGQSIRYGGIKYQKLTLDLGTKMITFASEIHRVLAGSYLIIISLVVSFLALCALEGVATLPKLRLHLCKTIIFTVCFGIVAAFGMLAALVFSPILDDRLYFAALVNLTMVGCLLIYQVATRSWIITTALFCLGIAINCYYFAQARTAYIAFSKQFEIREDSILAQRAEGQTVVVIPDYEKNLRQYSLFLRLDSNDPTFYRLMAKYYGVQSIIEGPTQK